MRALTAATKLTPGAHMLEHLFEAGRRAAHIWLADNFDKISVASSVDIREKYF
jgi:hypothetical protein